MQGSYYVDNYTFTVYLINVLNGVLFVILMLSD